MPLSGGTKLIALLRYDENRRPIRYEMKAVSSKRGHSFPPQPVQFLVVSRPSASLKKNLDKVRTVGNAEFGKNIYV